MKQINIIEDVLIVSGIAISLVDIQTILGIIILSVQVCLILFKGGKKIYESIKKKDVKGVEDALQQTQQALEDIKDKSQPKDK